MRQEDVDSDPRFDSVLPLIAKLNAVTRRCFVRSTDAFAKFKSVFARQQGLTDSSYRRHDRTPDGVAFEQMRQFGKATNCPNESDYQEHYQDE